MQLPDSPSSGRTRVEPTPRDSAVADQDTGTLAHGWMDHDEGAKRGSLLQPNAGPGRFIVVEGNNGVGKSAVVRFLTERLSAATFHFTEAFRRFRLEAGMDREMGALPRFTYYLSATIELSSLVREELEWRDVVCDRYLPAPLSILVADEAMTYDEALGLTGPFEPHLVRPDAILLLTADHPAAAARLRARLGPGLPANRIHGRTLESAPFFRQREAVLRREGRRIAPFVELDTTRLTPRETREQAWALLASILTPSASAAASRSAADDASSPSVVPERSLTGPSTL
jgi:thymidylate kinase